MTWLHWLDRKERDHVTRQLKLTVDAELRRRHWGAVAGGVRRYYVGDLRGLLLAAGAVRYVLNKYGCGLLYRGQPRDWPLVPSLYRGCSDRKDALGRGKWLDSCLAEIATVFDPAGRDNERAALAQHYGLPTGWLDVADSIQTAFWFACDEETEEEQDSAVGYIYALAFPKNGSGSFVAFDLRAKPSEWLRPHIQQAWSLCSIRQDRATGDLSELRVCTFIVPRALLRAWAGGEAYRHAVLFPNAKQDSGYSYWLKAKTKLETKGLLPPPWLTMSAA